MSADGGEVAAGVKDKSVEGINGQQKPAAPPPARRCGCGCLSFYTVAVVAAAVIVGCLRQYPPDKHASMYLDKLYLVGLRTVARLDGSMLRYGEGLDVPRPGPSLQGKVAVITGSTKGIGFHAARKFYSHGASVAMTGTKIEGARAAAARVKSYTAGAGHAVGFALDLADFGGTRYFAGEVLKAFGGKVDYLILNGAMTTDARAPKYWNEYWISHSGHSRPYATNYLGHFLLTLLLVPYMQPGGSVVVVSSITAWWADPKWLTIGFGVPVPNITDVHEDLQRHYLADGMYAASKYAAVCFGNTLRRKVASQNIRVAVMTPGQVDTDLQTQNPDYAAVNWASVDAEEGARVLFESAFAAGSAAEAEFLYPYWFPSQIYRHDAPQHLAPRQAGPPASPHYKYEDPTRWIWRPEMFQKQRFRLHASVAPECDDALQRKLWIWSRDAVALPQRLDAGDVFAQSQDVWDFKPKDKNWIYGYGSAAPPATKPAPAKTPLVGKGRR